MKRLLQLHQEQRVCLLQKLVREAEAEVGHRLEPIPEAGCQLEQKLQSLPKVPILRVFRLVRLPQ